MPVLTILELMRFSTIELRELAARLLHALTLWPEGSSEHWNAATVLHRIRYVLARRELAP